MLHLLAYDINTPIRKLINISLTTGMHPNILKIAETIPIFKKGSRLLPSNYRPISLLSNLNKIFEKIVYRRVFKYFEEIQCIYSLQFGFRKKHSTNHALISITEKIRNALDNKKYVCGVFVDLQKAFDTVNYNILIQKLKYYGITGKSNEWFASYLKNRSQYVSVLGYKSKIKNILHGVPQGSVLGPLLFLIYINDLHQAIKNSDVFHFADDTNLLSIAENSKICEKEINEDLKILYQWLQANKISLNRDKTELICFRKNGQKINEIKVKINGRRIYPSSSIRYLGLHLDNNLNFRNHCDILAKKLIRANGMLCKARYYLDIPNLKNLYSGIFSSHMRYGCQIWAQEINIHNRKIFKLQNRAIRIITYGNNNDQCDLLYAQLRILKLSDLVKLLNCTFVHSTINDNSPARFQNYFHLTNQLYEIKTRGSKKRCIPLKKSNTKYGLKSIKKMH